MSAKQNLALIITADDYGYSSERNKGIVEAFVKGGVTRTSLMVNAGAAEEGVALAKTRSLPLGLHLNLSEGYPLSDPSLVKSLLNEDGVMHGLFGFPEAVKQGCVSLKEVQVEIEAQLEKFHKLTGHYPLYVDGHQHVHIVPGVSEIFCKCLVAVGVEETRLPVEMDVDKCDWLTAPMKAYFLQVIEDSLQAVEVFCHYGIRFTDSFFGLSTMESNMNNTRLQEGILSALLQPKLQPKFAGCGNKGKSADRCSPAKPQGSFITCELMVHPGYPSHSEEPGCGGGVDDFSQSSERLGELQIITSADMLNFYKEKNMSLMKSLTTFD